MRRTLLSLDSGRTLNDSLAMRAVRFLAPPVALTLKVVRRVLWCLLSFAEAHLSRARAGNALRWSPAPLCTPPDRASVLRPSLDSAHVRSFSFLGDV
jgi:hypothetical protein